MIRISLVQDENVFKDATGHYVAPACRVYGLRLRSTVLNDSIGDIEPIDDGGEV